MPAGRRCPLSAEVFILPGCNVSATRGRGIREMTTGIGTGCALDLPGSDGVPTILEGYLCIWGQACPQLLTRPAQLHRDALGPRFAVEVENTIAFEGGISGYPRQVEPVRG